MKKKLLAGLAALASGAVFAYNPPAGGQNMNVLTGPTQLTCAASSSGGGLFMPGPGSILFNPALPALEQRGQLEFNFTGIGSTNSDDKNKFYTSESIGFMIPSKMFVSTTLFQGIFCRPFDMDIGNTIGVHTGLSKAVSERINVGMNLNAGAFIKPGSDYSIGADLGVLYRRENLPHAKDFRFGFALMNLGKYYDTDLIGIRDKKSEMFPFPFTVKTGYAVEFFHTEQFRAGYSFDVTFPAFQDFIFDFGLMMSVHDVLFLNIGEHIDYKELEAGYCDVMPSVGIGIKVHFTAKNSEVMKKHNWDKSEVLTNFAWQQKYDSLQTVAGGARVYFGMEDTEGPQIQLWSGEDD